MEEDTNKEPYMDGPKIIYEGPSTHRTGAGRGRRPNVRVNYKKLEITGTERGRMNQMKKQTQYRDMSRG